MTTDLPAIYSSRQYRSHRKGSSSFSGFTFHLCTERTRVSLSLSVVALALSSLRRFPSHVRPPAASWVELVVPQLEDRMASCIHPSCSCKAYQEPKHEKG